MEHKSEKKIPIRRCSGCGERMAKTALIRVVRTPEGKIALDPGGRMPGRGAYLCRNAACLRRARKARRLEQALTCMIPNDVYEALEGEMNSLDG